MWWRNLKISKKLFAGFGSLVLLFVLTVFVMRNYIGEVEGSSDVLSKKVSIALELLFKYTDQVAECFTSMRVVQYREDQESIKIFKEQLGKTVGVENDVLQMHKDFPELPGPKHINDMLLPLAKQFIELADIALALIAKKQDLLEEFVAKGEIAAASGEKLQTELYKRLRQEQSNLTNAQVIAEAVEMGALLMENITSVQRDAWRAIAYVNAGRNIEDMKAIDSKVKGLINQGMKMKPLLSNYSQESNELEKLLTDLSNYDDSVNKLVDTCLKLNETHNLRAPILVEVNKECTIANEIAVKRVKVLADQSSESLSTATKVMYVSTICCVAFAVAIALAIARSISKPLNKIVVYAKQIGDGDLTIRKTDFEYEGRDEMGNMVSALADMVESQSKTMTNIVKIAEDLAGGASNLSAISEETNASMEEIRASITQAKELSESNGAALEESNAGVEEMSAGADTVARSATDSAAFISQTTEASNKAIETVRSVIDGMHNVDTNAKASEGKIRQLVSSVENVSSFVSVITGIADQTNLLALNAAIEAARAGEVGRGFAVVAEEVRKLAEESAKAAQNVNGIIKELQTGAQESIKATTDAGRLLVSTLQNAEEALSELNGALDQINKANDSIQNIAAIAEEQAASSKEVAQAIDNATKSSVKIAGNISGIQNASDETARATEGVAKHAEDMSAYSGTLSELLSKFKLDVRSANTKMLTGR